MGLLLAPAANPHEGVLPALRAATRVQHDRIEQLLALDAPMPLARYAAVLLGFQRFLVAWESELQDVLPSRLHAWLRGRSRVRWLAKDLAFLAAVQLPVGQHASLPCLPVRSVAAAFGSLYVIEGSALGGQVIVPRLQRDLGLTPDGGASYFYGFGERTGGMWREFRLLAEVEIGGDPVDRREACQAAEQTFAALIASLEGVLG